MKTKTVVLTGSTGVFGKLLIEELVKHDVTITLLIRADSQIQAEERVKELFKSSSVSSGRIKILKCDLTKTDLGLTATEYKKLIRSTTHILHAAASTRFTLPLNEARRNNVESTRILLSLAKDCLKLQRFGFVSTAYVAGKRVGIIKEEEFEHDQGFLNTYEESKYEAEMYVRSMSRILPIIIFRPSLIITPFKRSGSSPVNALTLGLFLVRKGCLPLLPGQEDNKLDIIDGELASQATIQIFLKATLHHLTYHLTSAQNSPQIKDFIRIIELQVKKKLPIRFGGDLDTFTIELKKITRFRPDLNIFYKKTQSFLPELAFPKIYKHENLLKELGISTFSDSPMASVQSILK